MSEDTSRPTRGMKEAIQRKEVVYACHNVTSANGSVESNEVTGADRASTNE